MIRHITIGLALAVALASLAHAQTVIYVDGESPANGPDNDWNHTYHYLQDAFAAAFYGDEVHVAEGTCRRADSRKDPRQTRLPSR